MKQRAVLYLRCSTGRQYAENQSAALRQLVNQRGYELANVYEDVMSGVKRRPSLEQLLTDAHRGKFDVCVIWSLDRLGRSMVGNLQTIIALDNANVQIVSMQESWLSNSGPTRQLLIGILSWLAAAERERIVERTRAGLERARRAGVALGRPRIEIDVERVLRMRDEGVPIRRIARNVGAGATTIRRLLRAHDELENRAPNRVAVARLPARTQTTENTG